MNHAGNYHDEGVVFLQGHLELDSVTVQAAT